MVVLSPEEADTSTIEPPGRGQSCFTTGAQKGEAMLPFLTSFVSLFSLLFGQKSGGGLNPDGTPTALAPGNQPTTDQGSGADPWG